MDLRKITRALEQGALGVLEVALACACAGIVVGIFSLTGLGMKLSTMLIEIAGGSLLALLFLTMIASIILGMGMPTTACYIVLAVLVAPALIKMGVVPLAAHLFVFYFGIISAITPPVALAAYAAAGIGNTDPFKAGWYATKLGLAGFVIPYMFVYGPPLLVEGTLAEIFLASISGLIGAAALAAAIQGWILERLSLWQRALLGVAGLCLIKPGWITDALGGVLLVLVVGLHFFVHREANRRQLALESTPLNPPKSS
jgi:TRAP transporter 4TM/12TM fusion protein